MTDSALYIEVYEWDEPDESPDAPDDVFLDPATLYHTAAMHDSDTVRLDRIFNLLKHPKLFPEDGLGVDVGDLYGNTALAVAAYAGHLRQLGPWFLERGANVNASVTVDVHSRTSISRTSMFLFLCNFGLFCEATLLMVCTPSRYQKASSPWPSVQQTPDHLDVTSPLHIVATDIQP